MSGGCRVAALLAWPGVPALMAVMESLRDPRPATTHSRRVRCGSRRISGAECSALHQGTSECPRRVGGAAGRSGQGPSGRRTCKDCGRCASGRSDSSRRGESSPRALTAASLARTICQHLPLGERSARSSRGADIIADDAVACISVRHGLSLQALQQLRAGCCVRGLAGRWRRTKLQEQEGR